MEVVLNDLGPVALPRIGKKERKEALEEFRKGKGKKSGGARGEGASDKRAVALEARERLGLPPGKGGPAPIAPMPCPRHSQDSNGGTPVTPLRQAASGYSNFGDDASDGSGTRTGPMTNSWGPVIIEGWPGVPETTEEGYTSSSSQPDSEATLVLPTREKKRQAIVEKHFDVSWPDLDYDARACLLYYLVDHGKVEEEDIAFTDDGGAFAADGAQPGSEGDAGWVAMLE